MCLWPWRPLCSFFSHQSRQKKGPGTTPVSVVGPRVGGHVGSGAEKHGTCKASQKHACECRCWHTHPHARFTERATKNCVPASVQRCMPQEQAVCKKTACMWFCPLWLPQGSTRSSARTLTNLCGRQTLHRTLQWCTPPCKLQLACPHPLLPLCQCYCAP